MFLRVSSSASWTPTVITRIPWPLTCSTAAGISRRRRVAFPSVIRIATSSTPRRSPLSRVNISSGSTCNAAARLVSPVSSSVYAIEVVMTYLGRISFRWNLMVGFLLNVTSPTRVLSCAKFSPWIICTVRSWMRRKVSSTDPDASSRNTTSCLLVHSGRKQYNQVEPTRTCILWNLIVDQHSDYDYNTTCTYVSRS